MLTGQGEHADACFGGPVTDRESPQGRVESGVHPQPRPPDWLDLATLEVPSGKMESSYQLQRLLFAHPGLLFNRKYPGLERSLGNFPTQMLGKLV